MWARMLEKMMRAMRDRKMVMAKMVLKAMQS